MSRRATIRTEHGDAELVARALEPDNTDEMETTVDAESSAVVTRIERETTSGLQSTVDDYVVNLDVAIDVANAAEQHGRPTDAGPASDTEPTNNNE
ncbi:KEOPS complex subunit Pcc1 [Natronobacterium texcoconense]|uniref:KEOPS complex subunit Pcc1 n=1 Tax=Natronobacterium texcoconense TaxID=1095778 RepID=A0A1H1APY1_NATTX|nr:KEOPS complex subunit Pcc1 [Natronobacterium texcoconense]SDQ41670.1 hypothetical protein SAMN04489842_0769 [Natronobacterium texcoconense]